ncbi:hypothetical protein BGX29_009659 [Mortierella sp. GBA35]|nr:hypothetical protein BGX29_009659 [Mortierella sp. GBA35]
MSTLPPPLKPSHPLDLPEIRTNISSFLSLKDCVACLRVSHAWYQDFIWAVWFSVGPLAGHGYMQLTPEVVAKYGGYIRDANIIMDEEFVAFRTPASTPWSRFRWMSMIAASILEHIFLI